MADISPRQLELNREKVGRGGPARTGCATACSPTSPTSRRFDDASFDVGRLLRRPAQLPRRPRGGGRRRARPRDATRAATCSSRSCRSSALPCTSHGDAARPRPSRRRRADDAILRTGVLPQGDGYGHLPMKLFRWSELDELLSRHGKVVAASAAGLLPDALPGRTGAAGVHRPRRARARVRAGRSRVRPAHPRGAPAHEKDARHLPDVPARRRRAGRGRRRRRRRHRRARLSVLRPARRRAGDPARGRTGARRRACARRACLECLAPSADAVEVPLVPMTYSSLLEAYGWDRFAADAARPGRRA